MSDNAYLDQVMQKQQRLEGDLKARKNAAPAAMRAKAANGFGMMRMAAQAAPLDESAAVGSGRFMVADPGGGIGGELSEVHAGPAVDVRITGWWRWKTVVVPPNVHVVHTRRGHDRPITIGLGRSFRYNPATDSYLVVPGTMQTILINAQCICKELQGLLVQGYVQWVIADFATAYKALDFTDADDPMRVVNVQLREQAEAAIKDKVATMSIDAVLSDKEPIIEELTARLRAVAEGAGLRIITVQIKEAVVSSRTVWDNLQKPFRSDRARVARLVELETEKVIAAREASVEREVETGKLDAEAELATLRARHEAAAYDREQTEALRRNQIAEQVQRSEAELARARAAEEAAARQLETERTLALTELERAASNRQAKAELELLDLRQKVTNSISAQALQARLVELLPEIADKLPKPGELTSISINAPGDQGVAPLAALVAQVMAVLGSLPT